MKLLSVCFLAWTVMLSAHQIYAQDLAQELAGEDFAALAVEARRDGNIVRGAILFHQGNINCAKCHRPAAASERFGPDLSRMDRESTDAFVIESILFPSKQIKRGFETVAVLEWNGRSISGLVFAEDSEKVVIRDSQNIDQLVTILRDDIDESRAGKKSSMPDGLIGELKNRAQFLDLTRYVLDLKDRGHRSRRRINPFNGSPRTRCGIAGAGIDSENELFACHDAGSLRSEVSGKQAPRLRWSGKWLNPVFLERYIADPHKEKPGTSMPAMLGHLTPEERADSAKAIVHFIAHRAGNHFRSNRWISMQFHEAPICTIPLDVVACHPASDGVAQVPPAKINVDDPAVVLGELSEKYSLDALVAFIEDPHRVRSSGFMPGLSLTRREATDVASFLLQGPESKAQVGVWKPTQAWPIRGRSCFGSTAATNVILGL